MKENRELAASLQNRISTLSRENNVNNRNHELFQRNEELNMIKNENKVTYITKCNNNIYIFNVEIKTRKYDVNEKFNSKKIK